MIGYARRSLRAQLGQGRALLALSVFGVALGIASVLSIQLLNRSSLAAFSGGVQAVSGEADLTLLPTAAAFPESLIVRVLADRGVTHAWPLYQVNVALEGREKFYLDVVGVDLFAGIALMAEGPADGGAAGLTRDGWVAISPALANELGLDTGSTLVVSSGTRRATLVVGALVDFQRLAPLASRKIVVMDLSQAQRLLGTAGELTQIDVRLLDGEDVAAAAARLRAAVGPVAEVVNPEQREQRAEGLMRAFRLNLTALSFISVIVGFFLVHSATQAALVRRRAEFGILRSCGATRGQVFTLIAGEVAMLGLLGAALGIPAGILAARANIDVVSGTLTNLYLLNEIERLDLPFWLLALTALLGMLGTAAGAIGPARDIATAEVRELLAPLTLHERAGRSALPALAAGAAIAGVVLLWYVTAGRQWAPAGFVLAFGLGAVVSLATPAVIQGITALLPVRSFGFAYALRGLASRLATASFAVASLAMAVAMLVGITIMVGSFRETLVVWINSTLQADVYVTTPSWRGTGAQGSLDSSVVAGMTGLPGVRAIDQLRGFQAVSGGRRFALAGIDLSLEGGATRFALKDGRVPREGEVLITEPLSRKANLAVGDSLVITTPRGERRYPITGVSYDYSTENGAAAMDLATMADAFGPGPINSIALYLEPGTDPERFIDVVRARFPERPLNLRSNRALRAEVIRIFDQTFAVTRLLQVMALLVAACGITLTLLVLARERRSELALYRALGAGRHQILRLFLGKGLAIGLLGLALGAIAGAGLAAILVLIINRAWFGWTIQVALPWRDLAVAVATILGAAALASIYPAARASATPALELSRDDL